MDLPLTPQELARLPDRQSYRGVPLYDQRFRDSNYPDMVFECVSRDHGHRPCWWAFQVEH